MIRGIDVSVCQGHINWAAVKAAGIDFAYLKCSEGNRGADGAFTTPPWLVSDATRRAAGSSGPDPRFAENVAGARAAGVRVGAYHFAYPLPDDGKRSGRTAIEQAKFALDFSGGLGQVVGDLPPCLDLEWPPPERWRDWGVTAPFLREWAVEYLSAVRAEWGCTPTLYTYPSFWHCVADGAPRDFFEALQPCLLWAAAYGYGGTSQQAWPADTVAAPKFAGFDRATFWQFSGGGMRLPGTGVPVDGDVFTGSADDLEKLCGPVATTPEAA